MSIDAPVGIEVRGLTKRYSEVTAVDTLDLTIRRGEVYGFLGRNGAGKTTTIRMLVGLIRPTAGRVVVLGHDVSVDRPAAVAAVGSLVEAATSYPNLTVRENLEIQRTLTYSPRESVERALAMLGLEALADRRAGHLSLGNKQRLALARALLPAPRLLILDEPANALDPAGIVDIRRLLRRQADEEGVTVFVSSHILSEVAQLADRIGIIHQGRLIEEISSGVTLGVSRLRISVSDPEGARELLRAADGNAEILAGGPNELEIVGGTIGPSVIARLLVESKIELSALYPVNEDLEAHFLRLTGGLE
ncbi:MAG TPA: ATP-binding cassette domain-containing protein [Spirochaetia bacterium]|nr:ATP-binding cassette domain-containing protein [Spirochaetia bacterium]